MDILNKMLVSQAQVKRWAKLRSFKKKYPEADITEGETLPYVWGAPKWAKQEKARHQEACKMLLAWTCECGHDFESCRCRK